MFNTIEIARRIRQARIDKNMTQMNLAEAMGVSYQAVSNWERGNSMPDISKLEDLCKTLDLSVEELLGMETKTAAAVNQVLHNEPLTVEELKEVAPILPPEQMKEKVEETSKTQEMSLEDVPGLAPFLEEDYVENLVSGIVRGVTESAVGNERKYAQAGLDAARKAAEGANTENRKSISGAVTFGGEQKQKKSEKVDLSVIAEIAPFLGQDFLDELIRDADVTDLEGLEDVAPFLSKETMDYLVDRLEPENMEQLVDLAPLLSKDTLDRLVQKCVDVSDFDALEELAPFLSKDALDKLADRLELEYMEQLVELAPFMSKETLDKLVQKCVDAGEFDGVEELAPFLSKETVNVLVNQMIDSGEPDYLECLVPFCSKDTLDTLPDKLIDSGNVDYLACLAPFLSRDTLKRTAKKLLQQGETDAIEEIAEFLK